MDFLTTQEMDTKVEEWLNTAGRSECRIQLKSRPALLVIDMQQDYLLRDGLVPLWGGPAIIPNICALADAFERAELPIVYTRFIYELPEQDGGLTAKWWNVDRGSMLLRGNTWHSELHPALRPGALDRIVSHRRYSAFYGTDLELLLRSQCVDSVVIAGVMTNVACMATAQDAFMRDFRVYMAADGTGTVDEETQIATLKNLAFAYGHPVSCVQILHAVHELKPWRF